MSSLPDPHQPTTTPHPAYPLTVGGGDPRFTLGVVIDVARVLAARGYPPITAGADIVALQQALFGFLYRPASGAQ